MTWTKLGDTFTDDPRLLEVTRSARMLHVEALVYCNRHLRDGHLPQGALGRITDAEDAPGDADQLVRAGLWDEVEGGWQIDWTDQESAEEVRERQRYRADKQKRYRDRKNRHERGDHSDCDPRYCKKAVTGHVTSNGDGNVTGRVTPSRPVPSRPKTGTGTDSGTDRADARPPAAAPEAPFRVFAADDGPADADVTPWDIFVSANDSAEHLSFVIQPPARERLSGWSVDQIENGEQWFVAIVEPLVARYAPQLESLREKHRCNVSNDGTSFYCDVDLMDGIEPMLEMWVPASVGDAWVDRVFVDLAAQSEHVVRRAA